MRLAGRLIAHGALILVVITALLLGVARISSLFAPHFVPILNQQLESSHVVVEGASVRWYGFNPVIEIDQITHPDFVVHQAQAELSVWDTLWRNRAVFRVLQIDLIDIHPQLNSNACVDIFSTEGPGFGSVLFQLLVDSGRLNINLQSSVRCDNQWFRHQGKVHAIQAGKTYQLTIELRDDTGCPDCLVTAQYRKQRTGFVRSETTRQFDLSVKKLVVPPKLLGLHTLNPVRIDGNFSLSMKNEIGAANSMFEITPETDGSGLTQAQLSGRIDVGITATEIVASVDSHLLQTPTDSHKIPALSIVFDQENDTWIGWVEGGHLRAMTDFCDLFGDPSHAFNEWINLLHPAGRIESLFWSIDASGLSFLGDILDLSLQSVHGSPALDIEKVSLQGHNHIVKFDARVQPMQLHWEEWFSSPWIIERGEFTGLANLSAATQAFEIESRLSINPTAEFVVGVGLRRNSTHPQLTFGTVIESDRLAFDFIKANLPLTFEQALRTWLEQALIAGETREASMFFHRIQSNGPSEVPSRIGASFLADIGSLQYEADWPVITNASSRVWVDNDSFQVNLSDGVTYGSHIEIAEVTVPFREPQIIVNFQIDTLMSVLLDFLTDSRAQANLDVDLSDYDGSGSVDLMGRLNLPIGEPDSPTPTIEIDVGLVDAVLRSKSLNLQFSKVNGLLHYTYPNHFSSQNLQAELDDQTTEVSIRTQDPDGDQASVLIDFSTSVTDTVLRRIPNLWISQLLEGQTSVDGRLSIPLHDSRVPEVSILSELEGMAVALPLPIGKEAETAQNFDLTVSLAEPMNIKLYAGIVAAEVEVGDTQTRGRIGLNSPHIPLAEGDEDWILSGSLTELVPIFGPTMQSEVQALPTIKIQDVSIDHFDHPALPLNSVNVSGLITAGDSNILIQSDELQANVSRATDSRWQAAIDYLEIRTTEENDSSPAIDSEILNWLPAFDFSIKEVFTVEPDGTKGDFGDWTSSVDVIDNEVHLSQFIGNLRGLAIQTLEGQEFVWNPMTNVTSFVGTVSGGNLTNSLTAFDIDSEVRSESFNFNIDVSWVGSPFNFDTYELYGSIDGDLKRGSFVDMDQAGDALRILSVLNIAQIVQRLGVNFFNLFREGLSFDRVLFHLDLDRSLVLIDSDRPITIKSSGADIFISGTVDIETENIELEVVVRLPLSRSLPWYVAILSGNPTVMLGTLISTTIFEDQIDRIASHKYKVTGTLSDPETEFVGLFQDKLSEVDREDHQPPTEKTEEN